MELKLSIGLPNLPAINEQFTLYICISPSGLALLLFSVSRPFKMNAGHSLKHSPQSQHHKNLKIHKMYLSYLLLYQTQMTVIAVDVYKYHTLATTKLKSYCISEAAATACSSCMVLVPHTFMMLYLKWFVFTGLLGD
jgi:hypothetical protein